MKTKTFAAKLTESELKTIAGGQGCGMDPNGAPAAATTDNGCGIDPNGKP